MNKNTILFLGDSITANFKLLEHDKRWINLGVGGDKTTEILARIEDVFSYSPQKLFLLIGINDFLVNKKVWDYPCEINIIQNIEKIMKMLNNHLPRTKLYCLSILPIGINNFMKDTLVPCYNEEINELNQDIKNITDKFNAEFVNINPYFKNNNGQLKEEYTLDGIHLTEEGYVVFLDAIKKYVA